jgi:hypothetical protein
LRNWKKEKSDIIILNNIILQIKGGGKS